MTIPKSSRLLTHAPSREGAAGFPRRGAPRRALSSEHDEQAALVSWARLSVHKYPDLSRLFAIPNGGHRSKAVAGKLKAEGVRPGVLDLCLPVARGGFFGLYIEMKSKLGRASPEQLAEIAALHADHYLAFVCHSADDAADVLKEYLSWEPTVAVKKKRTARCASGRGRPSRSPG